MTPDDERLLRERVDTLFGSRTKVRTQAAVRILDLQPILQIKERLQAVKASGAAPTKAEFDALVDDVEFMRARLYEVMMALQAKLLP